MEKIKSEPGELLSKVAQELLASFEDGTGYPTESNVCGEYEDIEYLLDEIEEGTKTEEEAVQEAYELGLEIRKESKKAMADLYAKNKDAYNRMRRYLNGEIDNPYTDGRTPKSYIG